MLLRSCSLSNFDAVFWNCIYWLNSKWSRTEKHLHMLRENCHTGLWFYRKILAISVFCVKFNVDLIHSSRSEFFLNRIAKLSQEQNQTFSIFVSRASAHSMETLSKSMSMRFLEFWSVSGFLKFSKKLNFNSKFGRHSFSVNSFISKLFFS